MCDKRDTDPACDVSGRCVAASEDRPAGVSSCKYCGKMLVLGPHGWLTWNHEDHRDPKIQDEEPRHG